MEKVAPKFEDWHNHYRYKIAYGGRGAGAKSTSSGSLLVQFGERPGYFGDRIRVLCVRDVQKTLRESSWLLIKDTIKRLRFSGWQVTKEQIRNEKNDSLFVFAGLNDLTADNLKSFQDFDILFAEEAAPIGYDAWDIILPTFRKPMSEIWAIFNRTQEVDPCYDLFVKNRREGSSILTLAPGPIDNPWWHLSNLPQQWEEMKKKDPEKAIHVYEGQPRIQGENSIFSRISVHDARNRIADDQGVEEVGVDVGRFGNDPSQMYRRKGMKVIAEKEMKKADTNEVAEAVWHFCGHDQRILIKIDEGYNPGVIDVLRKKYGCNVLGISFGGAALEDDKYANAISEMWFEFPINEAQIPDDQELATQLTSRKYTYDRKDRKMVEPKDVYSKRTKLPSPNKADAILLTFYKKKSRITDEQRDQMKLYRQLHG